MDKILLDDQDVCPKCGHIGILHQAKKNKCMALIRLGNVEGTYCGCKVKRDLRILKQGRMK